MTKLHASAEEIVGSLSKDRAKLLSILLRDKSTDDIRPYPRDDSTGDVCLPTSWAQRRLWFIDQLEGGSAAYHIPVAMRLRGVLDQELLQRALDTLVQRHEVLRTVFVSVEGDPWQKISPKGRFALKTIDLTGHNPPVREVQLRLEKIEEAQGRFELSEGPLIRGRLLRVQAEEHVLLVTIHHIISDEWSIRTLIRELMAFYRAYRDGHPDPLEPLPLQYADYAQWQRQSLRGEALEKQLTYWRTNLAGVAPQLELPTDRPRPTAQSYRGANVDIAFDAPLTAGLKTLAQRRDMTLFMVLYAGWAILLSRLSGQEDVLIGTPISNRQRPELEGLIGFFVNTLVLRVRILGRQRVQEFLEYVKEATLGAYDHKDVPFEKVVEALQPQRSLNRNPLFQVMLSLQNAPRSDLGFPGLAVTLDGGLDEPSMFDLLLSLEERGDEIVGTVNYATDLFDRKTVERWIGCYTVLLSGLTNDMQGLVKDLPILSDSDRNQVIALFNATKVAYPKEKLVHELFESQVERSPEAIAVLYEGQSLTYAELNARANQLARYLREEGIGPDQLVGICMDRSLEMVVGLLGILKAGGAYVPLDPSYPTERLRYMLEDSAPRVILIQEALRGRLLETRAKVVALDRDWNQIAGQNTNNLNAASLGLHCRHLAYVIYTSGSTGQPKGAMNEHRGVVNRLLWMQDQYRLNDRDRVLQKTPFSFDVSVWEFFWALLSGARLIVARPEGHKDPVYLRKLIEETGVTTLHFVPSMLQRFLDGYRSGGCPSLQHIVCSGEELPVLLQRQCLECLPRVNLSNLYGPTEAAVDVTAWECRPEDQNLRVPIGRPISNVQLYVLDSNKSPVPIGVVGEIYIAGVAVGRGYLNRPELTAERFVEDGFSTDPRARMYRTGDLGRWKADGSIEYLGRNDHQVKIRGFRIELGEIEAQLAKHAQVKEVAVLAREDVPGDRRLVAYVTLRCSDRPTVVALREYLKSVLPEHMVPNAFVVLDNLPLSPNGKLDRRALPIPEYRSGVSGEYEQPQGEVEEILAGIWQALLGVEPIGRHDNFFELGGHSLLVVQMMERLRRVGLSAKLRHVFESVTLGDLASALTREAIDEQLEVPPNAIPLDCELITPQMLPLVDLDPEQIDQIVRTVPGGAANVQDIYPLAPLQEGILFHHVLNEQGGDIYIVATLLSVSSRDRLEELIGALQEAIDRHDILRTAVLWRHLPRPAQVVYRRAVLPVEVLTLLGSHDQLAQLQEQMRPERQRVDLQRAPLMRLQVAADPHSTQWYALLQLHHITCDHETVSAIVAEVVARLEGRAVLIESAPYRNHVAQALAHRKMQDAEKFFRDKLGDVDESTAPFALLDVRGDGSRTAEAREELEASLAKRVRVQARRLSVSAATLFHAAWGVVVARTSGRDDVVYGTVLLGRMQSRAGAQRIRGMFINTLPLRLRLRDITAKELVLRTQRELIELLIHEQASLADAQRCSGIGGSAPLFSVILNYRHSAPRHQEDWSDAGGIRVLAEQERTNYPIVMSVDDLGEAFTLSAQTDRGVDPSRVTGYLCAAVRSLVSALEVAPHSPAMDLAILSDGERHQVVELFNNPRSPYPEDRLIQQLFEDQVEHRPDRVAVVYEGHSLTYAELNRRANQLAWRLRESGVGPDKRVGICAERSLELVIGLLAILKAGGAYVPLDPRYPAERLQYVLEDAQPQVLLTQRRLRARLPETTAEVIALDDEWSDIAQRPSRDLDTESLGLQPHHLAYVIYTSGSTGDPKGVMIEHRSVVSLWQGLEHACFKSTPCRHVALNASLNFDASVQQLVQLLSGRSVFIVPEAFRRDPSMMLEFIHANKIEGIDCTPSQIKSWVSQGLLASDRYRPRVVLVGGEEIDTELWSGLSQCSDAAFYNVYGPTECTVDATVAHLNHGTARPHIGRPMENRRVYILDRRSQPVPIGVVGEIHIGGVGVGRGYLNRPALTAERFVTDPFNSEPEARMYKTGDLGRWRPDGTIEYLGRNDEQVKIRGFRIELGEIEAQLARHSQVKEAVVLAREDLPGDKRLVGYVIPRIRSGAEAAPSLDALRSHLKAVLPEHMIPSAFVKLDRFPLTANGKLDRRALPAPELPAYLSSQYEPPQGETEEILAGIWQALLGIERVGRLDNFFELGGHSLMIVQMTERLRRVGLSAEVRWVFERPILCDLACALRDKVVAQIDVPPNLIPLECQAITPSMLPLVELEVEDIERIVQTVPAGAANVQDIYPLAPLQDGILFHHLLSERGADAYARAMLLSLSSRERLEELITALQGVIQRHDVLRTAVLWEHLPVPVQVVYRRAALPVEIVALHEDRDPIGQLKERMKSDQQKLNLRKAPLIRLEIAADPQCNRWYALLRTHHLICDHQSLEILFSEVRAHLEDRAQFLPEPCSYRNHVAQSFIHARTHDAEAFFRRKLGDVQEPTVPFGLSEVHGDGSRVQEVRQAVEPDLARRLRIQARRLAVSAATLFHAVWGLVVARTSGRVDVVYGSVLLGRLYGSAGVQRVVGMFINTLPLRLRLQGVTVQQLVQGTQRELIELLDHEQASLAVAQRCSGITGSTPLFTAILNYRHDTANSEGLWSGTLGLSLLATEGRTNYPLVFSVDEQRDGFVLEMETDRSIDPRRILGYVSTAMKSLLEALEEAPQTPALSLSILPAHERHLVIERFNSTRVMYPPEKLVHELIEEQVERTPDAVAVVYEGQTLTYAELNGRANQLARYLRSKGVGLDQLVGICVERSLDLVVSLLATLKAGGAYVPLDPNYPLERIRYMIEDSAPMVVLTQERLRDRLPKDLAEILSLDHDWSGFALQQSSNLEAKILGLMPQHLAYVIYTSGSTGDPKGVMVQHEGVVNFLASMRQNPGITSADRMLALTTVSFDIAALEIYLPLISGAKLVVASREVAFDARRLMALLDDHDITVMQATPVTWQLLLNGNWGGRPNLKALCGGEALSSNLSDELISHVRALWNLYGPTETTIWSCIQQIEADSDSDPRRPIEPIGRPIGNTRVYVFDGQRNVVPIGVIGEVYIGGAGVARGYLKRPELTAQRFVSDPFSDDPKARMYKTGDLGRWRPDGTLEYLGRNDQQVKIRGYRIELGEIEAQLALHAQVKEAVVVAREDVPGEKRLVAYLTIRDGNRPRVSELREHLKGILPEHIIPSAYVMLGSFPLTPNGKLDRGALPAPELGAYVSRQYEAPQGEVEEILAGIWQDLLGLERIGRQDNFFELGGHSLFLVQMMERLRRVGLSADVRHIYASPTLAALARTLTGGGAGQVEIPPNLIPPRCEVITPQMLPLVALEAEQIERIAQAVPGGAPNIQDIYPLAPLQEGILFHHLLSEQGGDTYVLPTLMSVVSRDRLDELVNALQKVIDCHDVLRTAVMWEHLPRPVQVVWRRAILPVKELALDRGRDAIEQLRELMRPERQRLDLRYAPLVRLTVAADPHTEQWYALLQLHHLVCDNRSLDSMLTEVMTCLQDTGRTMPEAAPYRNHVTQALARGQAHDAEAFFRSKLAQIDEPTAPFALVDVHGGGRLIEESCSELDPVLAKRVRAQARRLGVSAATLFHAAWGVVVARTSGREDVVFGSVLLGRLQGSAGAQPTLGMFINTLPLRLQLRDVTVKELVEQTQRELVELLAHEQASLAVAQRCSGIAGAAPLFNTLLNYRHSAAGLAAEFTGAAGVTLLDSRSWTNYPITVSVDDLGEGFSLTASTDRRIDPARIAAYTHAAMQSLVESLEQAPRTPALAVSILPESERHRLLEVFNATAAEFPQAKTIHERFEEQVQRTPDAVAVMHAGQQLTYAELNRRANQLARYLRNECSVGPDQVVGICVERSIEMMVGLLAILKAGGAYMPLDPNYPVERLQYMLDDAKPSVMLIQEELRATLPATQAELVALDTKLKWIAGYVDENLSAAELGLTVESLVYVIYTSGSTGRPKGTAMAHRSMVNLIEWHRSTFGAGEGRRALQFAALSFDVAFQEIFSTLCTGGALVLVPEWVRRDATALTDFLNSQTIDRLFIPPLMLQSLAEYSSISGVFPGGLRDIITAGEQLRITPEISRFFKHVKACRLHNHYGPTETHVVTALTLDGDADDWPILPAIGRPISNIQMYVLDGQRQPVPIEVPGEIYIGGTGVARGYFRRSELTTQRFVENPFKNDAQARLYKTGDLGRWRADGTLEYLGRNDNQVKIRGYRIELGEIEAQLSRCDHVKEAVVIAREDALGEKRLVAYVTQRGPDYPSEEMLRAHLQDVLPDYMIPSAFVKLESLPLTPNGKLDRRALPAPEFATYSSEHYQPPEGEVEQILADIWRQLLGVRRVGREDNFFELGGHSLHGIKLTASVLKAFEVVLPVAAIFQYPTVQQMGRIVESMQSENAEAMEAEAMEFDEGVISDS